MSDERESRFATVDDFTAAPGAPADSEGRFLRAGCPIHYWVSGDEGGPVVVLTHGVTLDHGTFAAQVPALCEAGIRVITWDLRGHGLSQPKGDDFSIRLSADDLDALLDEVGVDRAVFVGQSFGGSVIQAYQRLHPRRVTGLVLVGTPELGDRAPWHQRLSMPLRPFMLRLWPERHLRSVIPSFMSRKPEVQTYVAEATRALSKADFVAVTEAALEGFVGYDRAGQVSAPVQVIYGDGETAWLAKMMQAWASRSPQVTCEVIAGAGHLANQGNPKAFNEALLRFLQSHLGAAQ
jgi:3-oxoadipate enol-lactonase